MLPVFALVSLLALLLAARPGPADLGRVERALARRHAPAIAGAAAMLCVLLVWGSASAVPKYHDEAAYLLQAEIFAAGRWKMPSPPVPEFFEQMYVLVAPVFAAKYPPGHSLLMTPGALIGMPGLVPLLLTGLSGALLFALARRVANVWVAGLAVALWLGVPTNLHFRASYFSETTTGACWLLAWWLLLRWRESERRAFLLAAAAVIGWGAITRPMTMLVYAIPLGIAVLVTVARRRRWLDLGGAVAVGTLLLLVLPLWSWRTLDSARTTPLDAYQGQYIPFDYPGFAAPVAQGTRGLPPDLAGEANFLRMIKTQQTESSPAALLAARATFLGRALFGDWRIVLAPAFAVGLFALGTGGLVALSASALLVLSYLTQAHTPDWVVYYLEAFPVVAFVSALGVHRIASWVAARANGAVRGRVVTESSAESANVPVGGGPPAFERYAPSIVAPPSTSPVVAPYAGARAVAENREPSAERRHANGPALATALLTIAALFTLPGTVAWWRGAHAYLGAEQEQFRRDLTRIPEQRAVVFVRYKPDHDIHFPLVQNAGDLARARVWLAHDRGADNGRLLAAAPDRAGYLYDEATNTFLRLGRP